ncbi:MAG: TetR/AcrR family transcriptional regulator [Planctomycetota bacterium]
MSRLPAAKRRAQLLDTAAELFAAHGYARATTSQLAKAAGVTEPIIYRHFKSKRDLFVALIERTGKETLQQWEQDLARSSDPAARLKLLLGDNPMVTESGRSAYRVILQAISETDDPVIRKALEQHIRSLHEFIATELADAMESGRVPDRFSPEVVAWLLIHVGMGYGVLSAMEIEDQGMDAGGVHVQQVLGVALLGRRPKSS